jgi:creatinine amidohydrolase/Fe(II)-dependent formamide hydrolase-like protein
MLKVLVLLGVLQDANESRPIAAVDNVFLEELTWMEVRDAIASGKTTVLVATGGIEQNGPYVVTGKHNVVLRATTEAIARKLGNALVAPIIGLVPEGAIEPPSGHMRFAGTISLRDDTFRAVLADVCESLAAHGFSDIVLIGDSGGNQSGMEKVASELNEKWRARTTRAHFVPEYYEEDMWSYEYLKTIGVLQQPDVQSASRAGIHDDYHYEAIMMTVDPETVRMSERIEKGLFSINGVDMSPSETTIANGKKLVEYRARITVAAIEKAIGASRRPPAPPPYP